MKFSEMAGTAIVPTLARLVLGLAFITVGYNKLATTSTFTAKQATILHKYGIDMTPVSADAYLDGEREIQLVQSRKPLSRPGGETQEAPKPKPEAEPEEDADTMAEPPAEEETPDEPKPETEEKPAESAPEPPVEEEATAEPRGIPADDITEAEAAAGAGATDEPVVTLEGSFEARSMHHVTLLCDDAKWPMANWLALVAAVTEFVGGIMLVVGLFSRIWALGLSVAMGVAFYLVSMRINGVHTTNPFEFVKNIGEFNTLFSQAGLFVLAFGILLTGPGPLSLDRLLFRKSAGAADPEDGVIIYDDPLE